MQSSTLVLTSPSFASSEQELKHVLSLIDPNSERELQMIDRVQSNLVTLPVNKYISVIVALDTADWSSVLTPIFPQVFACVQPGGNLRVHSSVGNNDGSFEMTALMAGWMIESKDPWILSRPAQVEAVPIKLNRSKDGTSKETTKPLDFSKSDKQAALSSIKDGEDEEDQDVIDEDELIDEADRTGDNVLRPPECKPAPNKKKRACKNCTCGLREMEQKESSKASAQLETVKLNDTSEIDFTEKLKSKNAVSSCGNCYLGDAFRCSGCPYIGLPAFNPGDPIVLAENRDKMSWMADDL
ncbi:anamorsin family protein [Schizosaccharomyces octosporus yFS286]|uniref:Anamorsin family protein n=1 Tax=Schizosaccharomyces octosporus (strain yFS286) TaxID=483514 RepID=S9R7T2_SCHOY|nr:anamorsin family protein [Schizosaccharomyces octosporus yFS286]EPX74295.1 anamorsin family protein [Schizosaccharomyces octosporus yFS286]